MTERYTPTPEEIRQIADRLANGGCVLRGRMGHDFRKCTVCKTEHILRYAASALDAQGETTGAPADWAEFVLSAFVEGWAAREGGEFASLSEAYAESHVKGQSREYGVDVDEHQSRFSPDDVIVPAAPPLAPSSEQVACLQCSTAMGTAHLDPSRHKVHEPPACKTIDEALSRIARLGAPASAPREPQPSSEPEGCIRCEGEQFDGFICEGCGRRLVCWQDGSFSWLPPETDDEDNEPGPASAPQTGPAPDLGPAVERLWHDIYAYRGALGYDVPGWHDGRLSDGTTPRCGLCNAREPREPHAALVKDATRYRTLRRLLTNAVGGGVEVNDAKLVYETPEAGEVVRLYWYPDTPVGFCEVKADTLDDALDAALGKGDQT